MPNLEDFMNNEFQVTRNELTRMHEALLALGTLFDETFIEKIPGWYYVHPGEPSTSDEFISLSTQAMCMFGAISILEHGKLDGSISLDVQKNIQRKIDDCREKLFQVLSSKLSCEHLWESETFGSEDIFTAGWIIQMAKATGWRDFSGELRKRFAKYFTKKIPDMNVPLLNHPDNNAGSHAFPAYHALAALNSLISNLGFNEQQKEDLEVSDLWMKSGDWFYRKMHEQLSFQQSKDFKFDVADLAFSLAGALDRRSLDFEDPLVDTVLDVICKTQEETGQWRPTHPILATGQGRILLPLSVEVPIVILKILDFSKIHGDKRLHQERFRKISAALSRYMRWLFNFKVSSSNGSDEPLQGWQSEYASSGNLIHLWVTAMVAIFLSHYSKLLDMDLQDRLLEASKFSNKLHKDISLCWAGLADKDVLGDLEEQTALEKIKEEFYGSEDPSYSMILYGPPGTSKTTIAEGLAEILGHRIVTITPSDFVAGGPDAVERQAKQIFEVLMELKKVVVLFDEIDRLILDRDSRDYREQSDIFQFMTPSMLTKLNDLRRKEQVVFIIATNYIERIDAAIKRRGRVDERILILPYKHDSRIKILGSLLEKNPPIVDLSIAKRLASRTPLYTYQDLNSLVKEVKRAFKEKVNIDEALIDSAIDDVTPTINLTAYSNRFDRIGTRTTTREPVEEFVQLGCLLIEVGGSTNTFAKILGEHVKRWTKEEDNSDLQLLARNKWVMGQLQKDKDKSIEKLFGHLKKFHG